MEYRNLGKSGLRVSELSYGSWVTFSIQLDKAKAKKTTVGESKMGAFRIFRMINDTRRS